MLMLFSICLEGEDHSKNCTETSAIVSGNLCEKKSVRLFSDIFKSPILESIFKSPIELLETIKLTKSDKSSFVNDILDKLIYFLYSFIVYKIPAVLAAG